MTSPSSEKRAHQKNERTSTVMDDQSVNEELNGKDRPFYITFVIFLLKIVFLIYDVIVFVPFKIWADPAVRLSMSTRIKAQPTVEGDPTTPWKHVKTFGAELATTVFPDCKTIAAQWNECVKRYNSANCFGTREVLAVHKENKQMEKYLKNTL
uniref:Transmembrane protein n=1 Tax=Heterorhabditis bacteriophora TaxID=37862 RepID=A0A1I7WB67_HETBA